MTPPRRIPTRRELERLQRLYRTDERIAERLGNVEPYLVAYWRRKRNVPNYSAPKFTEEEIRILWERFGDDDNCGSELGISRAAFYNWRRRYGIKEKPAFLKLEQMEFQFPGKEFATQRAKNYGKRSAAHKLLWEKRDGRQDPLGSELVVSPDLVALTADSARAIRGPSTPGGAAGLAADTLALELGRQRADDRRRDDAETIRELALWAQKRGVRQVYGIRHGSFWERLFTQGALLPGMIVACERGQERYAGAVGALGWGLTDSEISRLIASGELRLNNPPVTRVILTGKRYSPISATDITLHLARQLAEENVTDTVFEFCGKSLNSISVIERQTLCALSSLGSARSALTPFDALTRKRCADLGSRPFSAISADREAEYENSFQLNIELAQPMVARKAGGASSGGAKGAQPSLALDSSAREAEAAPLTPAKIAPGMTLHNVEEVSGTEIDVVFIGGSPGGHFDQLRQAAEKLRGKRTSPDIALFVSPLSGEIYLQALKKGVLRQFVEVGAVIVNPGLDSHALSLFGVTPEQTVATTAIEAQYSSFSRDADRYIVSPVTAAAAALSGRIVDPRGV